MATIFIERLQVETVIGICDWEREVEQLLIFDVVMDVDVAAVATSDEIVDALDYAAVAVCIESFVKESTSLLLESLLHCLGEYLIQQFPPIGKLMLTVRKPQAIATSTIDISVCNSK